MDAGPINEALLEKRAHQSFFKDFGAESKMLWGIIFTYICQYSLGALTQTFVGQVGELELSDVSVENSVIAGLVYEAMGKSMKSKSVEVKATTSLLRLVEQRIQLKRDQEERKRQAEDGFVYIPHLPGDCIFNIIVRLPLESLSSSRFVCKSWYGIVDNPSFVNAHLQRSDTGLIFLTPARDTKINFLVESMATGHGWPLFDTPQSFQINYMQIKDGKSTIMELNVICTGTIRTSCNGLILLENRLEKGPWAGGGLILLNPVTRVLKVIPKGTFSLNGSYGLAFCMASRKYKIVHLFKNYLNYIECEIMEVGSGPWRAVEGPPNGHLRSMCDPVLAMGALHWLPTSFRTENMVSVTLDDEKFKVIAVPESGRGLKWIFAMGEFLGFLGSCEEAKRMDVWVLRGILGSWEKQYSIDVSGISCLFVASVYYGRVEGELVFRGSDGHIYVYDHCHSPPLRKIEKCPSASSSSFCAHVSSLVSCRSL